MRRIVLILLLVASHGAVWWLGMRRHDEAAARAAGVPVRTERAAPVAGAGPEDEEDDDPEGEEYQRRVKAARDRITADTDVAAIVRADAKGKPPSEPERIAAFGVWLDRDPEAALKYYLIWTRNSNYFEVDEEIKLYFSRGNMEKLQALADAVPKVRGELLDAVGMVLSMEEGRSGEALGVAAGLTSLADRRELLATVFGDPENLAGHLAEIRGLLDRSNAAVFLAVLSEGNPELLEEAKAAGFPEAALEEFELTANPGPGWQAEGDSASLYASVPGFFGWNEQLREGRMTFQELYSRVKASPAGSAKSDADLAVVVAAAGIETDPEGMVKWLKETSPYWRDVSEGAMESAVYRVAPELLTQGLIAISGNEAPPENLMDRVASRYTAWQVLDPEACLRAIAELPPGRVKSALEQAVKKEAGEKE